MSRTRTLVLSTVLAVDIVFLLLAGYYYPALFESLVDWLPYENEIEISVILVSCFIIAVLSSYVLLKDFFKALRDATEWV
jgi:Kef-type K+ transport system membrane component KefB